MMDPNDKAYMDQVAEENLLHCTECQVSEADDEIGDDGLCPDCRWDAKHEEEALRVERRILQASLL